jgi:hypothetical protein
VWKQIPKVVERNVTITVDDHAGVLTERSTSSPKTVTAFW